MAKKKAPIEQDADAMPSCALCAFGKIDRKANIGQCHKFPPVYTVDGEECGFVFPGITGDMWCGMFEYRKNS